MPLLAKSPLMRLIHNYVTQRIHSCSYSKNSPGVHFRIWYDVFSALSLIALILPVFKLDRLASVSQISLKKELSC